MRTKAVIALAASSALVAPAFGQNLKLNDKGYFATRGLNVMVYNDYYPEGHQTGVTVVQHGKRVAANGDIRLEPSPGQWSAMPKTVQRTVDAAANTISQTVTFPNPETNRKGFNPVFYPDVQLDYTVRVTPLAGNSFRINVDLAKPVPQAWVGRVGFNFELFPVHYWGKSFLMDGRNGIFPRQPNGPVIHAKGSRVEVPVPVQVNGPVTDLNNEPLGLPLATGRKLVVAADDDLQRMTIESKSGGLELSTLR